MIPARVAKYQPLWSTVPGQVGLPDPYLVAAIGDRESNWGLALDPPGPAGTGDGGHGRGLMQIDDRAWPDWCASFLPDGSPTWQDPEENIRQGCRVLAAAWRRLLSWPAVIAAYNAGVGRIGHAHSLLPVGVSLEDEIHAMNLYTTGCDYVSDVLRRWNQFKLDGAPYTLSAGGMYAAQ